MYEQKDKQGDYICSISGDVEPEQCGMLHANPCKLADVYSIPENARLIACAPEMLEALEQLLHYVNTFPVELTSDRQGIRICGKAIDVIRKAREE